MKRRNKQNRFWVFLMLLAMMISTVVPTDITYAAGLQQKESEQENIAEEPLSGCVLDDGRSVFDVCSQNAPMAVPYAEESEEKQVVNEVVVFIRFADEEENIYEKRGGYDYIMGQYEGAAKSMASYVDEFSWGKVDANAYCWPQTAQGTPLCYVDEHPVSYYMKKSDSNPNGYTENQKSSRRSNLLYHAIDFMGEDFLEKLGIAGEPYNLVFMVPDCEDWNDLLWSHKSSIRVNGSYTVYNLITYESKEDISRTVTHEFMHSLGYPDMYQYYDQSVGAPEPVSRWSIMARTDSVTGHPTVHEKDRYGRRWIENNDAIQTLRKSGHYVLAPSTADPEKNTIAYKIPIEGTASQYFMMEYRGSSSSGFDTSLGDEGLIFYRVDTKKEGNSYGPPDELFVLREKNRSVYDSYYDGTSGRTEFSEFKLYNDTKDFGIRVYHIKKENGMMSFDIELPYVTLQTSKEGPISAAESRDVVLSTEKEENSAYRFGTILNGKEYELSGGYQDNSSVTVDFVSALADKAVGTHTLFADVKNKTTGNVKRATIPNYVITGMQVSEIITNVTSPQKAGTTIELLASVRDEVVSEENTYQYTVEKDGKEETLVMDDNYTAKWTPKEAGVYTIKYRVEDACGMSASGSLQYLIDSDTTAYVLYNNNSWNQAYIHYKVGNGTWTDVPGVKMADSDVEGYSWVYLLEVGKQNATVSFNNGNNSWDNNGNKNYIVTAGVNSIGGEEKKLSATEVSAVKIQKKDCQFKFTVNGGVAPYTYDCVVKNIRNNTVEESSIYENYNGEVTIYSDAYRTGEYILSVTVTDAYGQTVTKEKSFELEPFMIADIKTSVPSPQTAGTEIVLTEERQNAYIYKYGITGEWTITNKTTGKTEQKTAYYSNSVKWTPTENGEYEITANSTDHAGETATCTISYTIADKVSNNATVYYANASWNNAYIHYKTENGEWTTVPGELMETSSEQNGYTWKYTIDLGEESGATVCFNNGNGSWDSRNGANYTVAAGTYGVKGGTVTKLTSSVTPTATPTVTPTATPTITPTATPTPIAQKTATIYYANSSWNQAYIHFKTSSGSWTTAPGIPMETDNGRQGYTWKYVIDLTAADGATVCFNNGNNLWDSKNGANYNVGAGVYGIKNGTQEELKQLSIERIASSLPSPQKSRTTVTFTADIQGELSGSGNNKISWLITREGEMVVVNATVDENLTCTLWKEGTYEVTCTVKNAAGTETSKTIEYVISDAANAVTIYYNTGWDQSYLHYCIGNGSWTTAPGVKMTATQEKSGYNYKAVIPLGNEISMQACFNNGSGLWDSKNGANYTLKSGVYGVSNGTIFDLGK